ncbi:hypothetical protein HF521_000459 [Silurus meridionalis]|uniref:Uncharacterized protein n=1 Tax=Silurus meridionalis TaxID=175797 RepID=A0A8T0BWS8_SILME|nr:hypothetical protein HF521_000459 [Silurus meridionalis]
MLCLGSNDPWGDCGANRCLRWSPGATGRLPFRSLGAEWRALGHERWHRLRRLWGESLPSWSPGQRDDFPFAVQGLSGTELSGSLMDREELTSSLMDREELTGSLRDREELTGSLRGREELTGSLRDREELTGSLRDREELTEPEAERTSPGGPEAGRRPPGSSGVEQRSRGQG